MDSSKSERGGLDDGETFEDGGTDANTTGDGGGDRAEDDEDFHWE